ncbi:MAG: Ig-like domain-containing protein, partial [Gemmatimonadaceae bacterium]
MLRRRSIALTVLSAALVFACRDTSNKITSIDAGATADARTQPSTTISVAPSSATIDVGATIQLTATSTSAKPQNYNWRSSNSSVATVDGNGLVKGVAAGTATITASASGKSGSSTITVNAGPPPEPPPPPPAGSELLFAAGDIATCSNDFDEATAKVLDANPTGTVATLGDNAYQNGSASDFANCYNPTWGRHLARTQPSPGNHDYQTQSASGYFGYFGARAGDPTQGYYSYDIRSSDGGVWHIIALNSNIARDATSAQIQWLRADLQSASDAGTVCTIAYWHHPRFSSGYHGNDATEAAFWDALSQYNAEIVLNGHDHDYERFAPQAPDGTANDATGIREFIVGTGGADLRVLGTLKPNSQVFNGTTNG